MPKINAVRRDKSCVSKEGAINLNGTAKKPKLTEEQFAVLLANSLLFRMFWFGATKDGHWTGNKMKIQFEK